MTPAAAIAAALSAMMPPNVGCAAVAIEAEHPPLWPSEERSLSAALPVRRREFAAGRAAARLALSHAGLAPAALPPGPDRYPQWPEGMTGSIAHSRAVAIAVAGRWAEWQGIGVDLEQEGAVPVELSGIILGPEERPWSDDLTSVFCVKEAVQKALFPLGRELLEFHDISILGSEKGQRLMVVLLRDCGPFREGSIFEVSRSVAGGHVLAATFCPVIA